MLAAEENSIQQLPRSADECSACSADSSCSCAYIAQPFSYSLLLQSPCVLAAEEESAQKLQRSADERFACCALTPPAGAPILPVSSACLIQECPSWPEHTIHRSVQCTPTPLPC